MRYSEIKKATFISRPNRFVARVALDGKETAVHVKNTGRCRELLTEGAEVWLEKSSNPDRKYQYSLVTVKKGDRMVNTDSQAPNRAVGEFLSEGRLFRDIRLIRPECKYGSSRFDFYVEYEDKRAFIEVKGVTLENSGVVSFPDAPTERGSKHLRELCQCIKDGYEAYVIFVIQMKNVLYFTANADHDPVFARTLEAAHKEGVKILAYDCHVTENEMKIGDGVKVKI
ncbi:MAG: DNA/RNA nuclease SfsA [Ruminococcaceae bacterium]|nr:DNA/RNA nuclease SfsA [Oscillospiraceae bacterium]